MKWIQRTPKKRLTELIREHIQPSLAQLLSYLPSAEALATINPDWNGFIEHARSLEADFDQLAEAGSWEEIRSRFDDCVLLWRIALKQIKTGGQVN